MRRPLVGAIAFALTVASREAAAQQSGDSARGGTAAPADSMIPRDLVLALLGDERAGAAGLRVGVPGAQLPPAVIPSDARVLGSLSQYGQSTTVLLLPGSPQAALASIERALATDGWTRPTPPGGPWSEQARRMRGFLPSQDRSYLPPNIFCRRGEQLTPSVGSWSGGRTLVRIQYAGRSGGYMCNAAAQQIRANPMPQDTTMPALQPPGDALVRPMGSSSVVGMTVGEARAEIESRLEAPKLLDHYAGQMRQQGWTSTGEARHATMGMIAWRRRDAEGNEWIATLTIVPKAEPSTHHAQLRLERRP